MPQVITEYCKVSQKLSGTVITEETDTDFDATSDLKI